MRHQYRLETTGALYRIIVHGIERSNFFPMIVIVRISSTDFEKIKKLCKGVALVRNQMSGGPTEAILGIIFSIWGSLWPRILLM